jgi:tripartite-type tricarboxylate transporter receptor subunit TctC
LRYSGMSAAPSTPSAHPRNTPAEIIERLNNEINAGLADRKVKARLADLGSSGKHRNQRSGAAG